MSIKNTHALIAVIKLQQQQYDKSYNCSVIINFININNLNKKCFLEFFFHLWILLVQSEWTVNVTHCLV